ncbi:hypothetical protein [Actinoplanes sp. NPDC051411]|uniref:hypothetical protein n=1 Tax=Actinoplanes sp. NPDC051411 TaxID=3155522 RepID=UPI00341FD3C8
MTFARRIAAAMTGAVTLPKVEEFAAEVAAAATADVPEGHTIYVGGADYLG